MKKARSSIPGRSTLEVMEQAFALLRATRSATWLLYLLGSVPFLFLILYFWTDMSYSAFASRRVVPFAFLLACSYIVMKVCHAFFSRALLASMSLQEGEKIGPGSFLKEFRSQVMTQTLFIVGLPVSVLTLFPFGWWVAFFEHWALMDRKSGGVMDRISRNWSLARQEPGENHLLLWLTSPLIFVMTVVLLLVTFHFMIRINPGMQQNMTLSFTVLAGLFIVSCLVTSPGCAVVACNIGLLMYTLPGLFQTFLGVETSFSLSGSHFFNTTFILSVCVLAYLASKPLNLAVYVIRHFLSASIQTGEDLKASVARRFPAALIILIAGLILSPSLRAASDAPESPREERRQELQSAIRKSASLPEYAWRLPKFQEPVDEKGVLEDFFVSVGDFLKSTGDKIKKMYNKAMDWLEEWLKQKDPQRQQASKPFNLLDYLPSMDRLTWILTGLTVAVLIFAVWLAYRYRLSRRGQAVEVMEARPVVTPDLADETTTADLLPADEWMLLAEKLIQEGQYRNALRAMYLGLLARLAQGGFFVIHPAKSNRDYRQEFRLHSLRNLRGSEAFNACVFLFERCWYGTDPVDDGVIREFQSHYEQLRNNSR